MPFKQRLGKHFWLSTAWSQREEDEAQLWQWAVYSLFHKLLSRRKHDALTTTNVTNITHLFFYLQLLFSNRGTSPWQQCRAHLTLFLIQFFMESLRGRVYHLSLEYDSCVMQYIRSLCVGMVGSFRDAVYIRFLCMLWIQRRCVPGTACGCHGRKEWKTRGVMGPDECWRQGLQRGKYPDFRQLQLSIGSPSYPLLPFLLLLVTNLLSQDDHYVLTQQNSYYTPNSSGESTSDG